MKYGHYSDHFEGVAFKRLSDADTGRGMSRQHEIGITTAMREGFLARLAADAIETTYVRLDDESEPLTMEASATHYDARRSKSERDEEWRLYYKTNPVTERMSPGDALLLVLTKERKLLFFVAREASEAEQQLFRIFGTNAGEQPPASREFTGHDGELNYQSWDFFKSLDILKRNQTETKLLDSLINDLGDKFPNGRELSRIARDSLPEIDARTNPDSALVDWLARETLLFEHIEAKFLAEQMGPEFVKDGTVNVKDFLNLAKATLNRRSCRRGWSLEYHIAAILDAFDLEYEHQARTENGHKPDFLFPSADAYAGGVKGDICLVMLGAKSTCKDRWRQVLAEAEKIPNKHLLTLQDGISENQTAQMRASNLRLVVPTSIQSEYTPAQRKWLLSVQDFIDMVKCRQG